jgi:single-stranded DNA-specific DHH superfamily exonuclease
MVLNPDRNKFLENLNNAVDCFEDYSQNLYNNIIAISHNDADGISSLQIIQNLLHKMVLNYDYFIYNRSVSWANYLSGILPRSHSNKTALIFTDIGSNLEELIPIIKNRQEHFYILDHHEVDYEASLDDLPENLFFVNPTVFGFDGLDHVSGATLAYMFAKKINLSIIKQGWLAAIGIAGDSLKPMEKLQSFNKEVYQEICDEELVIDKEGLILFGNMHDSIKNSLKYSILPFLNGFGGEDDQKIKSFLNNIGINPNKKVEDLDQNEIQNLLANTKIKIGHFAILPKKQGLLKFAFEHAILLNILSFKNISAAISIIQQKSITRYAKEIYYEYISALSQNLKLLANQLPRHETKNTIFIDAGSSKIPPSNWSDTASFTSVNDLLIPTKMLFFGGLEKKTQMVKLSIRCSREYLKNDHKGVNQVINNIKQKLGGTGGGHKLAGGIRLSIPSFKKLMEKIEDFV